MLKLGEKIIKSLYLGDKAIAKVFLGDKLVYQANKPIFLDYISFDGNSWVDVEYIPSSNTRVVGKVSFTQWKTSGANYVFGVFGGGANFGFNVGSNRGILNVPWGSNSGIAFSNANNFNQVYSFDISKNGAYLDGVLKIATSRLSATFTATKSFFVGWSNGTSTEKFIGNVYPMQMYENDVLEKDLRPCLDPKGVACLYDMVTNKYHYNIGTGTIKAGNVIPDVAHTEIEYLEGNKTSYINTGVIGKSGLTIEMNVYIPSKAQGETHFIGSRDATTRFYPIYYSTIDILSYIGGYRITGLSGKVSSGWHHYLIKTSENKDIEYVWNGTNKTGTLCAWEYKDGELVPQAYNNYTGNTNTNMYLFGANLDGTPYIGNSYFTDSTGYIRFAFCKIWDSENVLIRDYIPVEKSDGVKCLYDKVEKKYYEFQTA